MSCEILIDSRWQHQQDGIGRFAIEIIRGVPQGRLLNGKLRQLSVADGLYLSWLLAMHRSAILFTPGFNAPWFPSPRFVFTIHDLIHLDCPEELSLSKRFYYFGVLRRAARRAFRVLTVSEFSKARILAWAGIPSDRVVVVGNGVGKAFHHEGSAYQAGFPYVLYVGNQKPHKNPLRLLKALAIVNQRRKIDLIMTGKPSEGVRAEIERLGLTCVHFTGRLSDDQLAEYYRGAQALILPSLHEGFGLPVVEAMACGTPVVCANVSALPEITGGAALLVDPHREEDIALGIERILTDDTLRITLKRAGCERAKLFSWDEVAARVNNVLRAACASVDSTR